MTYQPLDYRNWILGEQAREGVNIIRSEVLGPFERLLFEYAVPYQDQRNDPGQAEVVTLFALRLLEEGMPGDRNVVVPAAILHDTGWYKQGDPDAWKKRVKQGLATEGEALRRPAQNRAVYLAGVLLPRAGYVDEEVNFKIADIIGDHDTQMLPTTQNGLVLRCADMLWRFTHPQIELYFRHKTPQEVLAFMEGKDGLAKFTTPGFLGGYPPEAVGIAMRIARVEIANTMLWRHPDRKDLLGAYQEEAKMVEKFYARGGTL